MNVEDAETRLREMLCAAGIEGARESDWEHLRPATAADVAKAREIFARFAEAPVEGVDPEGGDVGASYGAFSFRPGDDEPFKLSIARGYVFLDEDDEYSHSALLHLEFLYTPTAELLALGRGSVDADAVGANLGPLDGFLGAFVEKRLSRSRASDREQGRPSNVAVPDAHADRLVFDLECG
jgi:hypothetical protein